MSCVYVGKEGLRGSAGPGASSEGRLGQILTTWLEPWFPRGSADEPHFAWCCWMSFKACSTVTLFAPFERLGSCGCY